MVLPVKEGLRLIRAYGGAHGYASVRNADLRCGEVAAAPHRHICLTVR